jgi:hypothetical protein
MGRKVTLRSPVMLPRRAKEQCSKNKNDNNTSQKDREGLRMFRRGGG